MAEKTILATLQDRHDPAATWTSRNPILHIGEHGYESDTGKYKIGDGVTTWRLLNYSTKELQDEIDDLVEMITTEGYTPEITNTAPIVTVGKGKDSTNTVVDYSTSVINGFADYKIKGGTRTNAVINGNFANGTANWRSPYGTLNAVSNELTYTIVTASAASRIDQTTSTIIPGHVYYMSGWICPKYSGITRFQIGNANTSNAYPTAGIYTRISSIIAAIDNTVFIRFYHSTDSSYGYIAGDTFKYKYLLAIDLTATYGAGLEPSQADMDSRMAYYPNGWFDKTVNVGDFGIRNWGTNGFNINAKPKSIYGTYTTLSSITNGIEIKSNSAEPTGFANYKLTLKPNTQYTISYTHTRISGTSSAVKVYDVTLTVLIASSTATGSTSFNFITPNDGMVSVLFYSNSISEIGDATFTNIMLSQDGAPYEPYRESIQYINMDYPHRSLPSTSDTRDSTGKDTKNVSDDVTTLSSNIKSMTTSTINVDVVSFSATSFSNNIALTDANTGNIVVNNGAMVQTQYGLRDDIANIGKFYTTSSSGGTISFIVAKGSYADIATAKLNFPPQILRYQLATPIVTQHDTNPMEVFENGTTIIEPAICNTGIYGTRMLIDNTAYPIKTLESVTKIVTDDDGKHEIPIALSTCTISTDLLGFTSTALSSTDVAEYSYFYDPSLTALPTISATYPINVKSQIDSNTRAIGDINDDISDLNEYDAILDEKIDALSQVATASTNGLESSAHYTKIEGITSTSAELNILDGAILSTTELNCIDGVTSNVQSQLNLRLPLSGGTLTGKLNLQGTAASIPLQTRNIVGSNGTTTIGELYIQYGANSPIYLGSAGGYNISSDGSVYSGTATNADKLDNQHGSYFTNMDNMASGTTNGLYTLTEKTKLSGVATGANNYIHPVGDGNMHVPATGTTNSGKVLTAGATAGSLSWTTVSSGSVSGKKYATLVVGITTSGHTSANCDYLCDGTNDQVEINNAIAALPSGGGKIIILEGTYDINSNNGNIVMNKVNTVLEGMGNGTKLVMGGAMNPIMSISANHCDVNNLCISSTLDGIYNTGTNTLIENCYFSQVSERCIVSSGNNCKIIKNDFISCSVGIFISGGTCDRISGNYFASFTNSGITLIASNKATIANNICDLASYTSSIYSIRVSGTSNNYNYIAGNIIYGKDVICEGGTGNKYSGLNEYN